MADSSLGERVERFAADVELALRELRADIARQHADAVTPALEIPPAPVLAPVDAPDDGAVVVRAARRTRTRRSLPRRVGAGVLTALTALTVVVVLASTAGPLVLPYRTYFVQSGSMAPTIPTGAMVVVSDADPVELDTGDVIVFDRPGNASETITHRIVAVDATAAGPALVTKGDANATVDPWRVPVDDVRGKLLFHVPLIGSVFGFLGAPAARWALVLVPLVLLVTLGVVRRSERVSRRGA